MRIQYSFSNILIILKFDPVHNILFPVTSGAGIQKMNKKPYLSRNYNRINSHQVMQVTWVLLR